MKYQKSTITEEEFIRLLEKELNQNLRDSENISDALCDASSNYLLSKNKNYPNIYYFWYIAGSSYVLVTNHADAKLSLVYEIKDSVLYSPSQATELVLRDTAKSWSGDQYSIMSEVYGYDATKDTMKAFDKNACIWFERGCECDIHSRSANSYLKDEHGELLVYETAAEAQAYIDTLEDDWVDCENDLVKAYYYTVVPAPTAAVLVPSTPLLLSA